MGTSERVDLREGLVVDERAVQREEQQLYCGTAYYVGT